MHHKKIHLTIVKLTFLNKEVFLEVLLETISPSKKKKKKKSKSSSGEVAVE